MLAQGLLKQRAYLFAVQYHKGNVSIQAKFAQNPLKRLRFPKLKVNPSPFELLKQNSID
jgi:hypothetical protein